jgi:exopolysaccharide production protein ExoZ
MMASETAPRVEPSINRGFVPGVHAARAVAVTLVLAAHVVGLWTNQEGFRYLPWQAYLGLVIDPLRIDHQAGGHMGLLLFFLVSGYIVSQAAEGETRASFALKRGARLLPVMILAVGATLAVASLDAALGFAQPEEFIPDRAYSWHALAEAVGLGPTFGGVSVLFVLWTLNVEYQWYAMLWAGIGFASRRPVATTIAFMAIVFALVSWAPGPVGPLSFNVENLTYVYVILIGRWLYLMDGRGLARSWGMVGIVTCMALYAIVRWPYDGAELIAGLHPRLAAVIWATAILAILLGFVHGKLWRPVAFIADVSYGIYLFHIPAMWLVLPVVSPGGRWFTLGLAMTVALVLAAAWLSYRFVETPIRRAVRRRLGPPTRSGDVVQPVIVVGA